MLTFDSLFLILVAVGAIMGLIKGFVRQLLGLIGIVLGIYVAYHFSGTLALWWSRQFDVNKDTTRIILFIVMVVAVNILAMVLAKLVEDIFTFAMLAWLNRLAGMVFGAIQVVFMLAAILFAYNALGLNTGKGFEAWLEDSACYSLLIDLAHFIFPYINFGSMA